MMNLCKGGGLIRWILWYCNSATPSCVLWKHGCTHFCGFILRNIPNKLGFSNDVSKNSQIYSTILVIIIFMREKVVVLSVGIWKGMYGNILYTFAFYHFTVISQRKDKKISLSHSFIIFLFLFVNE